MDEIFRMIIARSPRAAEAAARAMQSHSQSAKQQRLNALAPLALGDPDAAWTTDERGQIAAAIGEGAMTPVAFRVSLAERKRLEDDAESSGKTLSEYIRYKLFE